MREEKSTKLMSKQYCKRHVFPLCFPFVSKVSVKVFYEYMYVISQTIRLTNDAVKGHVI